eukprot:1454384-Rhodomonas_salina.1
MEPKQLGSVIKTENDIMLKEHSASLLLKSAVGFARLLAFEPFLNGCAGEVSWQSRDPMSVCRDRLLSAMWPTVSLPRAYVTQPSSTLPSSDDHLRSMSVITSHDRDHVPLIVITSH